MFNFNSIKKGMYLKLVSDSTYSEYGGCIVKITYDEPTPLDTNVYGKDMYEWQCEIVIPSKESKTRVGGRYGIYSNDKVRELTKKERDRLMIELL